MKYLNLTLKTPAENLACDEVLLDACESGEIQDEILRFWEPKEYFVVLGYSNKIASEVNQSVSKRLKIPIFRRASGGGTVLQGPGCLNYSLILRIDRAKELSNLIKTNHYVLSRHQNCTAQILNQPVKIQGISDLTIGGLKFSGNAQRRKKNFLLYHGTFLINFDIDLIQKILSMPSKQPDYRSGRRHIEFLMNVPVSKVKLQHLIKNIWQARNESILNFAPISNALLAKYSDPNWNMRF